MRRYSVARFSVSASILEDGDRVELEGIGEVVDGVIVVLAATVRGPADSPQLEVVDPCAE